MNVPDAYESPLFNPEVDRVTGYRTHSLLCMPILDQTRRPFAVMMLLNKEGGGPFDARDERALGEFAASIGVILETWNEASKARRGRRAQAAEQRGPERSGH